jgi:hypothetical protein
MNLSDNETKMCMLETNSGLARCLDSHKLPGNSEVILPVHISRRIQGEKCTVRTNTKSCK